MIEMELDPKTNEKLVAPILMDQHGQNPLNYDSDGDGFANMRDDGDGFTTISELLRYTDPVTGKNIITNIMAMR
jgi:hypothetical protein